MTKTKTKTKTGKISYMPPPLVYECPFDLRSAMMMIGKFGPKMPPEHLPKNVAISSVVHRL